MSTDETPSRDALRAELGLQPTAASTPARSTLHAIGTEPPTVLSGLAAQPARGRPAATVGRIDADGRVVLKDVADQLSWGASSTELVAFVDHSARRVWLTPAEEPCPCEHCPAEPTAPEPSPAFVRWQKPVQMQSKRRLKLDRGLWAVVHAAPADGLVLAVAAVEHDALLLTAVAPLLTALTTDIVPVPTAAAQEVAA